jgi:light-regulated signal transduction histidine kinase (bacteriophytochrome)
VTRSQTQMPLPDMHSVVTMLQEELQATNHEVLLLTLELEQRVAERTAELSRANQELRAEIAERLHAEQLVKHLNKDLERRAELLQAANEELEAFSYSVSHDLRNPLARILGFAELIKNNAGTLPTEKDRQHVERICEAATQMAALIDDLLRFSHAAHVELKMEAVDLNALVSESIPELEQETRGRNIVWKRPALPIVSADASLLKQAFVNLISNALKYTRPRDPAEIEIGSLEGPSEWILFVRDNGVGFDPQKVTKLFGAFQRLHDKRQFEGTGIGLANVRRIILRHGGRVWAEAKPDAGAVFYLSLPRKT